MKICIVLMTILGVLGAELYATAQRSDYLIVNGVKSPMNCNPLEGYFDANPSRRPKSNITSSDLWRGYVATFAIKDSHLWIEDIEVIASMKGAGGGSTPMSSVLGDVFPRKEDRSATWFTGFLILPQGEVVNYVHMGYASTYQGYKIFFVGNGAVLADRVFTAEEYDEYKRLQFDAFAKTDRYKSMKSELDKEHGADSYINPDSFCIYMMSVSLVIF